MTSEEIIVTFFTTHAALRAEKVLKQAGIAARLIPAPRALSADCTIALVFPATHHQRIRELLQSSGIETSGVHQNRRGEGLAAERGRKHRAEEPHAPGP